MRGNFLGGQSTTGGAGTLTITSAKGLALPSSAFVNNSHVEYSIVEYTDSTLSVISKAESGFGNLSSNVLTRYYPRTTWNGTTYDNSSPGALSFGTTNVFVYISPIAEGGPSSSPATINISLDSGGYAGWNLNFAHADFTDFGTSSLTANFVYYFPYKVQVSKPVTDVAIDVTTAGTSSQVNIALATVDPVNGKPGRIVLAHNGFSSSTTGFKTASITEKFIPSGWYYGLITTNVACTVRGMTQVLPNPLGFDTGTRIIRTIFRSRTFANFSEGDDALSGVSLSWSKIINLAAPNFYMR